jgi:hypothetical protein
MKLGVKSAWPGIHQTPIKFLLQLLVLEMDVADAASGLLTQDASYYTV